VFNLEKFEQFESKEDYPMLNNVITLQLIFYGGLLIVAVCWIYTVSSIFSHYLMGGKDKKIAQSDTHSS
jgi:hypothetical protein